MDFDPFSDEEEGYCWSAFRGKKLILSLLLLPVIFRDKTATAESQPGPLYHSAKKQSSCVVRQFIQYGNIVRSRQRKGEREMY